MGKTIVGSILLVVVLLIGSGVYIWSKRHDFKGDLSQAEERHMRELVSEAAIIFTGMTQQSGFALDDMDFLSPQSKGAVSAWMDKFQKNRKEFERA